MKVKIKKQKKNFQPIKMEVVFESQEEINDLYNRVNINHDIKTIRGSWEIYEQLKKLI
jgi:hypothetical protein|tara:strand:+ start:352 stop:525 length:174 start_codon:yes stop_codon:yes gene_type:complete